MSMRTIAVAPVVKKLRIEAPLAHAFEVFTARIGAWWPKTHSIGKVEMKEAAMEPRAGGRWYEKGVDGSETEWGKVLIWEPPLRVELSWHLNSKFERDEAMESRVAVRFAADGPNATIVHLEHSIQAVDAEAIRANVDSPRGWGMLLGLYADTATKHETRKGA